MKAKLDQFFGIYASGSTVKTEILAGITTFLTMAYIIFVNPLVLSEAGMPNDSVFVATCIVAMLGSFIMGFYANWPVACAPGMGLNAYFSYTIVQSMGYTWQAALGAVFISGCLFVFICLCGLREILIKGIPDSLRIGITAGIGLFLALIGLRSAGFISSHSATLLTIGRLNSPMVVLASIGFFSIIVLEYWRVRGSILISIIFVTFLSFFVDNNEFQGLVAFPPSLSPTFLRLDLKDLFSFSMIQVIFVLFLVEIFDATGTMMGVASRINTLSPNKMQKLKRALFADSISIPIGALLGTSSTTVYLESTAGIQAGGRTGLTAVVVGLLFFLALFFSPIAKTIPSYATAPALLYISCLMLSDMEKIQWDKLTELVPSVLTVLMIAFSSSIADGIAFGFISYNVLKIFTLQIRDLGIVTFFISMLFFAKLYFLHV